MVDVLVIIVLLTSAVLGFWTGAVIQFIRLVSVLLSTMAALVYGPRLAEAIKGTLDLQEAGVWLFLCPLGVLVVGLMACYLITVLFSGVLKTTDLSLGDRLSGAGLGLLKGVLIVGVVVFLSMANAADGSPLRNRVGGSVVAWGSALTTWAMVMILPEDIQRDAPGGGEWVWPDDEDAEDAEDAGVDENLARESALLIATGDCM